MRFKFDTPAGTPDSALVEQARAVAIAAHTPLELVFNWLSDEHRSIEICPGLPEPQDEGDITLFLLEVNSQEVGQAIASESEIKAAFPDLRPVSEALLPEAQADVIDASHWEQFMEGEGCDEAWFEELDKKLKPVWNDDLCESILSREAAIYLALCYALARNGSASLSMVGCADKKDLYESVDFSEFPNGIFSLTASYNHEKNGLGFGTGYLVV